MFTKIWNWITSLFGSAAPAPASPIPMPVDPVPVTPPSAAAVNPTIQKGSTGAAVVTLQQKLASLGYSVGGADGDFGAQTQAAVELFQSANGLSADGVVGPLTWSVLLGASAKPAPVTPPAPTGNVPAPRASNAGNIKVCLKSPSPLKGIDVSDDEPNTNWAEVLASGYVFGFFKVTEGNTITDSQVAHNMAARELMSNRLIPYHFFRARDTGADQAAHMIKTMGSYRGPIMLDWETLDGQSAATNILHGQQFIDAMEAAGYAVIIYTDDDCWNQLGNPQQFNKYPLYVANIETTCPSLPPPWSRAVFWQFTWTQVVPGVSVKCDADLFDGTLAQLDLFLKDGTLPF